MHTQFSPIKSAKECSSKFLTSICLMLFPAIAWHLSISPLALAEDLPARKPGLWQIEVAMEGSGHKAPPAKHCIDATTDKQMLKIGTEMGKQMGQDCTKNSTRKEGSAYIVETDCKMMGTHVVSKTVISGDFSSKYTAETSATYNPPMMGMSSGKTKMTATWVGPCEAGQKPGDMIMAGGMKMNISELSDVAGKMGGITK